jgi:hypothetical protein
MNQREIRLFIYVASERLCHDRPLATKLGFVLRGGPELFLVFQAEERAAAEMSTLEEL